MSTPEHLLMQIFDLKSSIESQLKRQVEYHAEFMSDNMQREGKKPPQWLWSTEFGGLSNLDDLIRGRLIPGISLSLSSHAIPSNSGHFTKPDRLHESNNFMKTAEYAGQIISDKDILNEHEQNKSDHSSKLTKLKGIDNLMESDPYPQFRKNDQELPLSNKQNRTDSLGNNSDEQKYSSALTQSRSANGKAYSGEQPSLPDDPLHHGSVDKDRIAIPRSASQSKCAESLEKLSDSSNHVKHTGSGECNVAVSQIKTHTSNPRLNNTCISGRLDTGFEEATNVYSTLKMPHDVAPLPDVVDVVEPKKLHFDVTVECNFSENPHMSAEKNNEPPQNVATYSGYSSEGNMNHPNTRKNGNLGDHIQSTPNKKRRLTSSVKSMYNLRSLNSNSKNEASSESRCRSFGTHLLQDIETHPHEYENSWPKRKKGHYRSNNILATSPGLIHEHTDCINTGSESMVQPQPSFSAMSITGPHSTDLKDCSNIISKGCLEDETNIRETTICAPLEHNSSKMDNTTENLLDVKHSTKVHVRDNDMRSQTSNTANSLQYDVTMTEYEGFNMISSSSVDETILSYSNLSVEGNERVSLLEQLSNSMNMIDLASCSITSYKMNNIPIACQSSPDVDQLLKHINITIDSGIDASFNGRPHSHSMPYSRSTIYQETKKIPLTPPIMKSSQKTILGQSGASVEKHDCNPELVCFRIDENFSIFNEKEHAKKFDPSEEHTSYDNKTELIHKDTLTDDPIKNKNKIKLDRYSVQSVAESSARANHTPRYAVNRKSKMDSGNVNKYPVRKADLSLRNRSFSKPRIFGKLSEPSKRHNSIDKVFKPNNIVSNAPSSIPFVFKAAATTKGRNDIKIKAIETAEHSKRREVKRQHEREMRKAAAQLKREKLQQESRLLEIKQKQKEEEKKRKDEEVATRKRQRGEENEREQKRRCFGKTSRQKDETENMLRPKVAGEKNQRKETMVEDAKGKFQKKSGVQNNIYQKMPIDTGKVLSKPKKSQVSQTIVSVNSESRNVQSYELSPYTNSDDEDEEMEGRRRHKFVPLWARSESLERTILSKCQLNPAEIFCRKRSFIVNEVLQMPAVRLPVK